MATIYIETHGCTMNTSDSEIIRGLLREAGHEIVSEEKLAEIIVLNTCIVKTDKKMINRLKEFETKGVQNGQKFIVAGCMPQVEMEVVKNFAPSAAAIIGPHSIHKIADIVKQIQIGQKVIDIDTELQFKVGKPKFPINPVIWTVPIAEGCNSNCSYCIVRFARGRLVSYPKELIVREVEQAVKNGFKEIELTAQDVGAYGLDLGYRLPELLHKIDQIDGKFLVRVGMLNPKNTIDIVNPLAEALSLGKIYKFLHLPIQSGDNQILNLMNRGYTAEDCIKIIEKFREKIPELTLSTDIIAGFPSENETQFENSYKLIEKIRPDIVNITRFSPRPGTPAAEMKGQTIGRIAKERSRKITKLRMKIGLERNQRLVGGQIQLLITELGKPGSVIGRTTNYKPVVIKGNSDLLGKFASAEITAAHPTYLEGKLIESLV